MIFGKLKRIHVQYIEDDDCTEILWRARKFENFCRPDGDISEDEDRLSFHDRIAQRNFERWKDFQIARFIGRIFGWRPVFMHNK